MKEKYIGRELKKLSNKIHREIDKFASKSELTGAEGRVLHFLLGHEESLFQKDIEVELGLRSSTATEILKRFIPSYFTKKAPLTCFTFQITTSTELRKNLTQD